MSTLCPPSYTPSHASPSYSAVPHPDEICLTRTARVHHPHRATRVLVLDHEKKSYPFSAAFLHQEDDSAVPTYTRGDIVDGYVALHNTTGVISVAVKLLGQTHLNLGAGGKHSFPFLQYNFELWHQDGESVPPDHLDFVLPLPTHVDDEGVDRPLPSTSRAVFSGPSAVVEYIFKVVVVTKGLGGVFKKSHSLSTPITYVHRSHPPHAPLGRDESFLSTVKVAPEEWVLLETIVPQLSRSAPPLSCMIAVPGSRIFSISQSIPIHVQLTGAVDALQQFLPLSDVDAASPRSPETPHRPAISRPNDQLSRRRSYTPASQFGRNDTAHRRAFSASSTPFHHLHMLPPLHHIASSSSSPYASPYDSPSARLPYGAGNTSASSSCSSSPLPPTEADAEATIQLSLQRRITIAVMGERTWRVQKLSPAAELKLVQSDPKAGWLAWSGTITPSPVASWSPASRIGGLNIAEYISLDILKTRSRRSAPGVLPHTHCIPVKLVTDPFPEDRVTGLDEQDLSALGLAL